MTQLRIALRGLWRARTFSLPSIATMALGIGSCTAIFSFVNGILLRPFPYPNPGELSIVQNVDPKLGAEPISPSIRDYLDYREGQKSFASLACFVTLAYNLPGEGSVPAQPLQVNFASSEFFRVMGVAPLLGRAFQHAEENPGPDLHTVLISHRLWKSRFGGDAGILGRKILLDTTSYVVTGVMPEGFQFGYRFNADADAWAPLESWLSRFQSTMRGSKRDGRGYYQTIGRLAPGVSLSRAQSELSARAAALAQSFPATNKDVRTQILSLREAETASIAPYAWLVFCAATLLLAIACANATNLLLIRAHAKDREMAIRFALGAGYRELIWNSLCETIPLSLAAAGAGVLLAWGGVFFLKTAVPIELPSWMYFELDAAVLYFAAGLAIACGFLLSLAPLSRTSRQDAIESIRQGSRGTEPSHGIRLRETLIAAQVAITVLLLAGAALVTRSFLDVQSVATGLKVDKTLALYISPPGDKYRERAPLPAYADLYNRILMRLRELPGVESAAGSNVIPYDGKDKARAGWPFTIEGQSLQDQKSNPHATMLTVSENFFAVMGMPIFAGRSFEERETMATTRSVIVSRDLADRFWPEGGALGKRLKFGAADRDAPWWVIVGVTSEVRYQGLDRPAGPAIYTSYRQDAVGDFHLLLRTKGDPLDLAAAARRTIWSVDPQLAVYNARSLESLLQDSNWRRRLWSWLFGLFSFTALMLSCIGIYGSVRFATQLRAPEFGIRRALGAPPSHIVWLSVSEILPYFLAGAGIGLAAIAPLAITLRGLDFPYTTSIIGDLLLCAVALLASAVAASVLPAWRATQTDPLEELRAIR